MADNALINTLLLANTDESASSLRRALDCTSRLWVSNTTDSALDILNDSSIELIISTQDFASSMGLNFFEQIMPEYPDPVRIMITEKEDLDSVVEAINKGRIYKYILQPWTDEQIVTVVREASDLFHLRTDLDKKVIEFSDQLIQAELNIESIIEDIQASDTLTPQQKFDFITRLKSTISLLDSPD
jgi:response regulator RpfG family c-di-GMP phosphodiesterase